jgi:hypothetical protein
MDDIYTCYETTPTIQYINRKLVLIYLFIPVIFIDAFDANTTQLPVTG